MRFFLCTMAVLSLIEYFCNASRARAEEPQKKPVGEIIPAPQQRITPLPIVPQPGVPGPVYLPPMPHPGTREVWQYYGVDGMGRFRPRVILSPSGSYYMQTQAPYPWTTNRTTRFMPYVAD